MKQLLTFWKVFSIPQDILEQTAQHSLLQNHLSIYISKHSYMSKYKYRYARHHQTSSTLEWEFGLSRSHLLKLNCCLAQLVERASHVQRLCPCCSRSPPGPSPGTVPFCHQSCRGTGGPVWWGTNKWYIPPPIHDQSGWVWGRTWRHWRHKSHSGKASTCGTSPGFRLGRSQSTVQMTFRQSHRACC